jgi:hypothetical protein
MPMIRKQASASFCCALVGWWPEAGAAGGQRRKAEAGVGLVHLPAHYLWGAPAFWDRSNWFLLGYVCYYAEISRDDLCM